jgi:hypothetical protein
VNGCSNTSQVTISVNPLPQVSISTQFDTVCSNSSLITLEGLPTGGIYSGNGVTGNNFDAQLVGIGNYIVTYTYSDNNACTNSADLTIVVDACTGVNRITDNDLIIYPNPTSGYIIIQSPANSSSTYIFYDISGKEVARGVLNMPSQQINLDNFSQGVYMLRIQNNKSTTIHRIVVEK